MTPLSCLTDDACVAPAEHPPALTYPFAVTPPAGTMLAVAPGMHWLRMPLPGGLDHINLWTIDEGDGWAVVDTGMRTDEAADIWQRLCAQKSLSQPITRILVTHMHVDHVGMAGWLARRFDCPLWMTRQEYFQCRLNASDTGREAPQDHVDFHRRAGWSDTAIEGYCTRFFGRYGVLTHALPESYRRLRDGDEIILGDYLWCVIVGMGHSPEHACLYCPSLKLFIAGDQVLPRISSNVSVLPLEPDANPMADWYASMARLKLEVPDDVLVLPSHNECFRGLHARIDQLVHGQDMVLERLRRALRTPCRVVDVFVALFARRINESNLLQLSLATGESLACLNYLIARGEAMKEQRNDGAMWYSLTAASP